MKNNIIIYICLLFCAAYSINTNAKALNDLTIYDGSKPVSYKICTEHDPVVDIALDMYNGDMSDVTGKGIVEKGNGTIRLYQANRMSSKDLKSLQKKGIPVEKVADAMDAFCIKVIEGKVFVVGNNGRGVAYGLLELSRQAGVSPWKWWGDVVPQRKESIVMPSGYEKTESPSVAYRGIFINDEDWSLRNWACETFEKNGFGHIGPKTYKKIYQLMLRLRANTIWPAMHEGTIPFFMIEGNSQMADSCGIIVGSSHCEPLLRNNIGEWDKEKRGAYNFITNRDEVLDYWSERLAEVKGKEKMFTIGMRGIHDGAMEGVKTVEEKTNGLQQVIDNQRILLKKYINKDLTKVPQVFIPYKEVLQIMENGLNVPDDVTLMWCDDNYGYMTRLSDSMQQKRSGGAGVYYHLSYWGRPHDYLWLTTTQPGLIYKEMKEAYDHNVKKLWLVNVHDPKAAAYDLSLFLDMAWNIDAIDGNNIQKHLENWLSQQFGTEAGKELLPIMTEFYRLTSIRKPEFMGWSQVELNKKVVYRGRSQAIDTEFSTSAFGNELERYLAQYQAISKKIDNIKGMIRPELHDAYFTAIEYPVNASYAMARKMLEAQMARSYCMGNGDSQLADRKNAALPHAKASMNAQKEIQELTEHYNKNVSNGKWNGLMDNSPRDLPVFNTPSLPLLPDLNDAHVDTEYKNNDYAIGNSAIVRNACDYEKLGYGGETVEMLGHSMKAVSLPKGGSVEYEFTTEKDGDATLYIALIPTQANDSGDIRFSVSIDGSEPTVYSLKEEFRSETWKKNVLRGQAIRTLPLKLDKGKHKLTVNAIDAHIILDQWMVDFEAKRNFYVFPIESALNK